MRTNKKRMSPPSWWSFRCSKTSADTRGGLVRRILKNKNGMSYPIVCVLVLVFVMSIMTLVEYSYVYHVIDTHKKEIEINLDSYMTKQSIEFYEELREGENYKEYIDLDKLIEGAYVSLGFNENMSREYTNSHLSYTMQKPKIEAIDGNKLGLKVNYALHIPFKVIDFEIFNICVNVEVRSQITEKY